MISNFILLDAAGGAAGGGMGSILMIVALFVIFYFFMIRPQQKRQKEIKKFRDSLDRGSKIVTAGGIYGTIKEVRDTYFIVEVPPPGGSLPGGKLPVGRPPRQPVHPPGDKIP